MQLNAADQLSRYEKDGYLVVPGLFSLPEVTVLREHFMKLRAAGSYPGDLDGVDTGNQDPLKRFPRMINMHRWDSASLSWLLDVRLMTILTTLLGVEPYAVQTMLYFKPPGGRGQAVHQDQFYLRVQPGTCMAAWLALDDSDEDNGCMRVVSGTHNLPLLCTTKADTRVSFTDVTVPLPADLMPLPIIMKAGDVLFFNGSAVHGSEPNHSKDRFRRALIGHYIVSSAKKVASFFHPVLDMNGGEVSLGVSDEGGPCGVWRQTQGVSTIEMIDADPATNVRRHE